MASDDDTSIRISVETWRRLKDLKTQPNESFDDVITDLLEMYESQAGEEGEAQGNRTQTPQASV